MKRKKCYNAGKISGLSYLSAYNKFEKHDKLIENQLGMRPVNPMIDGLPANWPWICHMVFDVCLLIGCSAVLFQCDFKESRGARIEHFFAKLFGKDIYHA